jgi:pyruvate dehydrogenase E2 component (dihydrolipoamide acetyltransferase)
MPTDVIMPQMGESIFEGTITKWLKKPGDRVQRDEPLFEISTDKVDAEIPSPSAGVLKEIKVQEGATVQVNTVVGVIAGEGEAAGATPAAARQETVARPTAPAKPAEPARTAGATTGGAAATDGGRQPGAPPRSTGPRTGAQPVAKTSEDLRLETEQAQAEMAAAEVGGRGRPSATAPESVIEFPAEERAGERIRSSPLVRRLAREHNVDLAQVPGTGLGGRITKQDIEAFIQKYPAARPSAPPPSAPAAPAQRPTPSVAATAAAQPAYRPAPQPTVAPAAPIPGDLVAMSPMRKKIAERMVESKRTSAHVHSVFEIDVTRIMKLREREKVRFEQINGVKLTVMPFFARAIINAIRQHPIVNTSVEGENIRYHRSINLGIAVALDWGLIVPVVKNAEQLNFLGLQRAITDLAERARTKKLKPEDVQGGTFTITNPGVFGPLFGTPIILQPQTAIFGMGGIFKTPVVRTDEEGNDAIVVRQIIHVSLGYDHRIVDGADADKFLATVKKNLEMWSEEIY